MMRFIRELNLALLLEHHIFT